MNELYDKNYFEYGIETGKSNYSRYRWIPELTIPMAMIMIDYLEIRPEHTILDFGCAKGFLVKAFRWLNRQAYGLDISKYAIENCDSEVKEYCRKNDPFFLIHEREKFHFCIAKDVFEHIELSTLKNFLQSGIAHKYFAVIPLGRNSKFIAPANDLDITHVNCLTEGEWIDFFINAGCSIDDFTYRINGIKDSYYEKYPRSHGFFTLS